MTEQASYPTFDGFSGTTFDITEWKAFWESLTDTQRQRVRDKAQWEKCTLSMVFYNWPSILDGVE